MTGAWFPNYRRGVEATDLLNLIGVTQSIRLFPFAVTFFHSSAKTLGKCSNRSGKLLGFTVLDFTLQFLTMLCDDSLASSFLL